MVKRENESEPSSKTTVRNFTTLFTFNKYRNPQNNGSCKLKIDLLSKILKIHPKNERFNDITATFEWKFIQLKNILFVFAKDNFQDLVQDFILVFKNEDVCCTVFNGIFKKRDTDSVEGELLKERFLNPLFSNALKNSRLIKILKEWIHKFDEKEKIEYLKLLKWHQENPEIFDGEIDVKDVKTKIEPFQKTGKRKHHEIEANAIGLSNSNYVMDESEHEYLIELFEKQNEPFIDVPADASDVQSDKEGTTSFAKIKTHQLKIDALKRVQNEHENALKEALDGLYLEYLKAVLDAKAKARAIIDPFKDKIDELQIKINIEQRQNFQSMQSIVLQSVDKSKILTSGGRQLLESAFKRASEVAKAKASVSTCPRVRRQDLTSPETALVFKIAKDIFVKYVNRDRSLDEPVTGRGNYPRPDSVHNENYLEMIFNEHPKRFIKYYNNIPEVEAKKKFLSKWRVHSWQTILKLLTKEVIIPPVAAKPKKVPKKKQTPRTQH